MLSFISSAVCLVLALQAQGHAIVTPALGGGTQRADVQRPTANAPCGKNVDIASLMATSQAAPVQNGAVSLTVTNFNRLLDGSRKMTAQIDPTGTGNSFQAATVTTNGQLTPLDLSSEPIVVQMPAGMQSTNGMMLLSFKNAFGFGNCVAVTDAASGASNSTTTNTTAGAATGTGTTTSTTGTGTGTTPEGAAAPAAAPAAPAAQGADPLAAALGGADPLAALGLKSKAPNSKAAQKENVRRIVSRVTGRNYWAGTEFEA